MASFSNDAAAVLMSDRRDDATRSIPPINTNAHRRVSSSTSSSAGVNGVEMGSSPTTSASSKTAAFFGTNGSTMRPPSLSGSPSYTSPIKERPREEGDGSITPLNRGGSWRGSQRSTRNWDAFEAKSITPLPSPGVLEDDGRQDRKTNSIFDIDFSQKGASTSSWTQKQPFSNSSRDSSKDRHLTSFDISISDSFPSLASLPSMGAIQSGGPTSSEAHLPSSTSSKTSNFFGTTRPPLPASTSSYQGHHVKVGETSTSSPPSATRRFPSTSARLYEPSRLPSMPSEPGFVDGMSSSATSMPLRMPDATYQPVTSSQVGSGKGRILGEATLPTATISPPSPHPEEEDANNATTTAAATTSPFLLPLNPSSPKSHRSQSRHAHGPSENATGSSLLPSAQTMHQARGRQQNGHSFSSQEQQQPAEHASTMPAEESEDEDEGRLGRFKIERILGVGAFSTVALARERGRSNTPQRYRKESPNTDGLVAIKMLEREPCMQNERMRVSWVREVEVLKHIVHPNIVRLLSSFSTPKHHNLVLEQVAGGELFELLSHHHTELAQREWLVRILFGELANAVGWMHSINLVHRDIKLENIILTHHLFSGNVNLRPSTLPSSPYLKISDFGLSRFVDPSSPLLETRCGSEEYAAPELIIGKRYDGRKTDVWAMGVVLYALLSGSLPFLGTEDQGGGQNQQTFSRGVVEQNAMTRKAHLLRIAKGDLRWPSHTNEQSKDQVEFPCPNSHRLITPLARRLVAKLLRRDALKRATAWEAWDEAWLSSGSIPNESSTGSEEIFAPPLDPRSEAGQAWLNVNARVQSGASNLTHND